MEKKTILHFIYNLGRGGAETMLVKTISELKEFNNIVVTLQINDEFGQELICDKFICLNLKYITQFPLAISKIKKIIKKNKVDLVHSHLFWPTVVARCAVPKAIPLITTIHAFIASSVEYKMPLIKWIDQLTYKIRKSVIVAVAKGAQEEYFSFLNLKPFKTYVLYTFVDLEKFNKHHERKENETFKIISVGALRLQKNQAYLIRAMTYLKNENVELHIYGGGPLQLALQDLINETGAKVTLKGLVKNVEEVLPLYDAFSMSSTFEGFSIAVLEAMASKINVILSDIASFKEQAADTALYFNLQNETSFVNQVNYLRQNNMEGVRLRREAFERVKTLYSLPIYMKDLRKIYSEATSAN